MQQSQTTRVAGNALSFEDTAVAFAHLSDWQLKKTYFIFSLMNQNALVKIGTFSVKLLLKLNFPIKWAVRDTIFEHFCGGETIAECQATIDALRQSGIGTILDYSVEGEGTEASFDATAAEILRTVAIAAAQPQAVPFTVFKVTGIGSADLLEKVQKNAVLSEEENAAYIRLRQRMQGLCRAAAEHRVRIFVDAEESWIQDAIDALTYDMMQLYNRDFCTVWNTYQMYCIDSLRNLRAATAAARREGYLLGVKLVRGAYMEKERQRSHEQNYADPIQPDKPATDAAYNEALVFCVENREVVSLCLGTHNEHSSRLLAEQMQQHQLARNDPRFWFAQLLGMSDNISFNLARAGYQVSKYVPYGPVDAVMPYLFRRAEENTSVAGQASREFQLVEQEVNRRQALKNKV